MTHVICRLTAKNRDQLRNPTLGNRSWATFTFLMSTVIVVLRRLDFDGERCAFDSCVRSNIILLQCSYCLQQCGHISSSYLTQTVLCSRRHSACGVQVCRGYGDPHRDPFGYGYGVGMGMIFHPHRPMGILWGFLINLK